MNSYLVSSYYIYIVRSNLVFCWVILIILNLLGKKGGKERRAYLIGIGIVKAIF